MCATLLKSDSNIGVLECCLHFSENFLYGVLLSENFIKVYSKNKNLSHLITLKETRNLSKIRYQGKFPPRKLPPMHIPPYESFPLRKLLPRKLSPRKLPPVKTPPLKKIFPNGIPYPLINQ